MWRKLKTQIRINLKFYRRNRLLWLVAVFPFLVWIMMYLPALMFVSPGQKFELLQSVLPQTGWFINVFVAALGVFTIAHHIGGRSYKMVVTKPCPPEVWLAACLGSAMLVSAFLHLSLALLAGVLLLVWHIPVQGGILYIALDGFFRSAILLSVLTFLTVVLHPVVAVLVALVINDRIFYAAVLLAGTALKSARLGVSKVILGAAWYICYGFYLLLPSFTPLEDRSARVYHSLKMAGSDAISLLWTLAYAIVVGALFFFLADYALRRKRLI